MFERIMNFRKKMLKRLTGHVDDEKPNRTRQVIVSVILVGVLALAILYLVGAANANGSLTSSGTVEAVEVRIAPELGGLVAEVLVNEGDQIEEGQPLLRLDDALLQNQREQSLAGLAQAKAGVEAAELELESTQQAYDELFDNLDLTTALALEEVGKARDAVRDAENRVTNLTSPGKQTDIDSARANVVLTGDVLDKAREDYEDWADKPEDNLIRASLQLKFSAAQGAYDDAVRDLNWLLQGSDDIDLSIAQAELDAANARLEIAEADYAVMDGGPDPDVLALAENRMQTAQAQLDAANANLAAAEAAVESADLQIAKTEIVSPITGTVLYRNIESGEIATPNATLFILAQIDNLTITVYLSEDRYGQVNLGDSAEVKVDSFPDNTFTATVIRIADEAEFTPRNVQTGEGRRTTVFAIDLKLNDPEGKLKPGMPADVNFSRGIYD